MNLVNQDGSINLKQEFKLNGVSARISGTQSGDSRQVKHAIDTIRLSTGEYKTITRADLYIFERDGRITTE